MKYYLWILGCAMNYSDAERISTALELLGYQKTDKETEADLIVTVACSVRQTAIDRIYGKAKDWAKLKIKNKKLKIALTGCVLKQDLARMNKIFDLILKIDELHLLTDFLSTDHKIKLSGEYLSLLPKYKTDFRAFVPIMTGCDNFCSYCAVPYTRGREKSRSQSEILKEITALIKRGYKEITLLGQNVNSYNKAISDKRKVKSREPFVALLRAIDKIPGDYRVYFYSNHPKDVSDELIGTMPKLKHFPAYLHLPLQSGNNQILKSMNRHYTAEQYLSLVEKIRAVMPKVVLTTDIIVGYPREGEKEFADTVAVVKKAKFEMIFIGQYSPRPGTATAKLTNDVSKQEKKNREKILTDLLRKNLENVNKKFVGKIEKVLVDEVKNGKYFGRTEDYKVVEIKTDLPLTVGQFAQVKITKSEAWKLMGSTQI